MSASLSITADLLEAYETRSGEPHSQVSPLLELSTCIDGFAKGYGLSETTSLAELPDPLQGLPDAGIIESCIPGLTDSSLPGDALRDVLTAHLVSLASSPQTRQFVGQTLTGQGFFSIAQAYWNIEANGDRNDLPVKPRDGLDIPTSKGTGDYAVMKFQQRMSAGVVWASGKTSSAAMRKSGARIAVLLGESLLKSQPFEQVDAVKVAIEYPVSGKPKARLVWTPQHLLVGSEQFQPEQPIPAQLPDPQSGLAFPGTRVIVGGSAEALLESRSASSEGSELKGRQSCRSNTAKSSSVTLSGSWSPGSRRNKCAETWVSRSPR